MSIENLIERLASDARPVQRHAFRAIVYQPLAMGVCFGLVVMMMSIGLRSGLEEAATMAQAMVGGALGLGSAFAGLATLGPSLRPDTDSALPKRILTTALIVLVAVAAIQLVIPEPHWPGPYPDANADWSPWMVVLLAIPSFSALAARVRSEAPTHLNVCGAALGLTSGGVGACLFSFGWGGSTFPVLAPSSLGIGLTTLFGMLIAPRLLRW